MDLQTLAMEWTETNQHWLVEVPIRIGAYLIAILIARFILHRMIDRATGRSGKAKKVSGDENAPPSRRCCAACGTACRRARPASRP